MEEIDYKERYNTLIQELNQLVDKLEDDRYTSYNDNVEYIDGVNYGKELVAMDIETIIYRVENNEA